MNVNQLLKYFIRGIVYTVASFFVFLVFGVSLALTNIEETPLGILVVPVVIIINGFLVTWASRIG